MLERIIETTDNDIRLDRWFKRHYPLLPHAKVEQLLRKGVIRLDNKRAKAAEHIKAGQVLCFPAFSNEDKPEAKTISITKQQKRELLDRVLHKNDRLLVFNKPSGLAVQGGTKTGKHLDAMLDNLKFGLDERPRLVHRLDKATSGILLLARTILAATELTGYFRRQEVEKTYWALLEGVPVREQGELVSEIDGREAKTEYEVIDNAARRFSWVVFRPRTGRKHQLRVHAALLGAAVVGDRRYGSTADLGDSNSGDKSLHLHARSLGLPTGELFTAEPPPHFQDSLQKLGFSKKID